MPTVSNSRTPCHVVITKLWVEIEQEGVPLIYGIHKYEFGSCLCKVREGKVVVGCSKDCSYMAPCYSSSAGLGAQA